MHLKELKYERLVSEGYNNRKIGVVVELENREDTNEAFERAKRYVDTRMDGPRPAWEVNRAKRVIEVHKEHQVPGEKPSLDHIKAVCDAAGITCDVSEASERIQQIVDDAHDLIRQQQSEF